jgi:hypothetical protein
MSFQYALAVRIDLALKGDLHPCAFKPKIEAADTGKK